MLFRSILQVRFYLNQRSPGRGRRGCSKTVPMTFCASYDPKWPLFQILFLVNISNQKNIDRNDPSSNDNISPSTPASTTFSTKKFQVPAKSEAKKTNENIEGLANTFKQFYLAGKPKSKWANSLEPEKRYKPGYWLPEPEEAETFNYSLVPVQESDSQTENLKIF